MLLTFTDLHKHTPVMDVIPNQDNTMSLYEASLRGSIATLNALIQSDRLILHRELSLTSFSETPLHISSLLGHLDFTKELLRLKPELATVLNSLKSSPLHSASAEGHTEIVKALLHVNRDVCLVHDQGGRIPLHFAVMRGHVEVIQELISAQPSSIQEKLEGDTVLHLCIRYNHLDALKLLVSAVQHNSDEFLNLADNNGNTILLLAAVLKQVETIRYLLSVPEVRAGAKSMKRILDDLEHYPEDLKILEMEHIPSNIDGTKNQNNLPPTTQTVANNSDESSQSAWSKWWNKCKEYLSFDSKEWLKETRGTLMVVATVIATMTFQTALSPPGGLWQSNINNTTDGFLCGQENITCVAGTSVLANTLPLDQQLDPNFPTEEQFRNFLICNTTTFLSSLSVVLLLISGVPLYNKLAMWLLTIVMCITLTFLVRTYLQGMIMVTGINYTIDSLIKILETSSYVWCGLLAIIVLNCTIRLLNWIVRTKLIPLYNWIAKMTKSMFKSKARRGASVEEKAPFSDVEGTNPLSKRDAINI